MHFALPPRKTSPPPYARVSARNTADQRRRRIQLLGYILTALAAVYLIYSALLTPGHIAETSGSISEDASVVIVTVFDEDKMSKKYMSMIRKNRDEYAALHGYSTFYTNASAYAHLTHPAPSSWAVVPALRHALTNYPRADYLWSLSPHAIITSPLSLYTHLFANLTHLIKRDIPVVPPDSVIHTFSHLSASSAYLILSQDMDNLTPTSFILRNTYSIPVSAGQPKDDWASYFLDAWFDPLYRAYAFQKAEVHALEHIVQWHPTILSKLVLVEQRKINSYNYVTQERIEDVEGGGEVTRKHDSMWKPGDLVVNLIGCEWEKGRDCEEEGRKYYQIWEEERTKAGRVEHGG